MARARPARLFEDVLALVAERGAVKFVPDLVEAIAGEKVAGSWWSHPMGHTIFEIANRLEDAPEILVAKLIDGKVTFLHQRLHWALLRVVTDLGWRRQRAKDLDAAARRLLRRVERTGRLDASDRDLARPRKALEARLLVRSTQQHSEGGRHVTILESWRHAARSETPRLSFEEATAALRQVGVVVA